jgi:hypothetical protein
MPIADVLNYDASLPVVKEIALRLTLPFGQRHAYLPEDRPDKDY